MATGAQKKAHAEFERRLKEAGGSKITVRLSPFGTKRLAELVSVHGSREKALETLLTTPQHPTPSTGSLIAGGEKKGAEPSKAKKAVSGLQSGFAWMFQWPGRSSRGSTRRARRRSAKGIQRNALAFGISTRPDSGLRPMTAPDAHHSREPWS